MPENARSIVQELKRLTNESGRQTFLKHGAQEPVYGVRIADLKKIQKRLKTNHQLALDLYATGVTDAMYLAGLIADDVKMTRDHLETWASQANWHMISECTVAWVAAGNPLGWQLAVEWIDSTKENIASSGWSTLSGIVSMRPDSELDIPALERLMARVEKTIHSQPNRVRYAMNGFLIALGSYVAALSEAARETAVRIGKVTVEMGDTSCKVPYAPEYIDKVKQHGSLGKKRKTVKC